MFARNKFSKLQHKLFLKDIISMCHIVSVTSGELEKLPNNAKIRSLLKFLLMRYYIFKHYWPNLCVC